MWCFLFMTIFSVTASPVYSHMVSYCPTTSLLSVLAITLNDLSFLLSPLHHTFFMFDFLYPLHLFSFLASLLPSVSIYYRIFMGSQWREDGGPGFGHWCGRARWLCQYPWPAGNSAGSTTIQSGAPSWEEVPDNIWECLLCVRENGVQMKGCEGYNIEEKHVRILASR